MMKVNNAENSGLSAIKVVAARKVPVKAKEDLITQITSMLKNNSSERISEKLIALQKLKINNNDNIKEECWLTLSSEMDGITYLDIYQAGSGF